MDMNSIGIGAGGSIGVVALILLFRYLNNHRVKIISSCCSVNLEEDRTPKDNNLNIKSPE
jgi:hypothetical protein